MVPYSLNNQLYSGLTIPTVKFFYGRQTKGSVTVTHQLSQTAQYYGRGEQTQLRPTQCVRKLRRKVFEERRKLLQVQCQESCSLKFLLNVVCCEPSLRSMRRLRAIYVTSDIVRTLIGVRKFTRTDNGTCDTYSSQPPQFTATRDIQKCSTHCIVSTDHYKWRTTLWSSLDCVRIFTAHVLFS